MTGKGWRPGNTVFIRLENPRTGEVPAVDQASAIVTGAGDFVVRFTYPLDPRWASTPEMLITARWTRPSRSACLRRFAPDRRDAAHRHRYRNRGRHAARADSRTADADPRPAHGHCPRPPTAARIPPTATHVPPTATPVPPTAHPVITDWRGEYFANTNLGGQPVLTRNDWTVDFNWGSGAPAAGLPADGFSARWTRAFEFDSATYRFYVTVDDGARLYVDGQLVLNEWRDSSVREVFADVPLARGGHTIRLEYYERTGVAQVRLRWERLGPVTFPDWKGEYWSNLNLTGNPTLTRNDRNIDFNWGTGAPAVGIAADGFSARWSRTVTLQPGLYRLFAQADDGIRVYMDGRLVINEWHDNDASMAYPIDIAFTGTHTLVVEYYERSGGAAARFWWQLLFAFPTATPPGQAPSPTPTYTPTHTPTATATATAQQPR